MKLSIKLSVAFLGLMLMVWGCDMSQVSDTDHSNSIEKLSPIPGSTHNNSVSLEYEIIDLGTLGGNSSQAWEIVQAGDGSYDLYLRAERNGPGTGRMYTITLTAEDEAGNISEKEITVSVPHDSGLN